MSASSVLSKPVPDMRKSSQLSRRLAPISFARCARFSLVTALRMAVSATSGLSTSRIPSQPVRYGVRSRFSGTGLPSMMQMHSMTASRIPSRSISVISGCCDTNPITLSAPPILKSRVSGSRRSTVMAAILRNRTFCPRTASSIRPTARR